MGGSVSGLIVSLLVLVIDIYIVLLFIRLFLSEYERYDAVLDMVFQATDPIVVPLATSLRSRAVQLVPLLVIAILLLLKGIIVGSIPIALQGFLSTLLRIYVLTIIVTAAFREAYLNPIVSFGQRMVRPVRDMARYVSPHPTTVDVLSVGILVILHTIALLVLGSIEGEGGADLLLAKRAFIYSLGSSWISRGSSFLCCFSTSFSHGSVPIHTTPWCNCSPRSPSRYWNLSGVSFLL